VGVKGGCSLLGLLHGDGALLGVEMGWNANTPQLLSCINGEETTARENSVDRVIALLSIDVTRSHIP